MSNFQTIDIIFAVFILLMVIHGYVKGFVAEIFSWAAPVLAIGVAVFLYRAGAGFIRERTMQNVKYVPEILAFAAIFIIIIMLVKMLEHLLKDVVEGAKLGGVNKLLGLVFGIIEGVIVVSIILFVLTVQPFFNASKVLGDSFFAQLLLPLVQIPLNRGKDIMNTVFLNLPGIRISGFFV